MSSIGIGGVWNFERIETHAIALDGSLFNKEEIGSLLGLEGETISDAQLILHAHRRWGSKCLERFEGNWAFAIWEPEEQTLFLSRDRFGVKPLFYCMEPHRFVFASDLKDFLYLEGFVAEENRDALAASLLDPTINDRLEDTVLKGVYRILPGSTLTVRRSGEMKKATWWNLSDHLIDPPQSYGKQLEKFSELLFNSVKVHKPKEEGFGVCVSGGIDSSSLLGVLAKEAPNRVSFPRGFVALFPEQPQSEFDYAKAVSEFCGFETDYIHLSQEKMMEVLPEIIYDMEEPCWNFPGPSWWVHREMRARGLRFSIDGNGSDEMFGVEPSPKYSVKMDDLYPWFPKSVLASFYFQSQSVRPQKAPNHWEDERQIQINLFQKVIPAVLRVFGRSARAHGIELRMPFLDWRLVSFVLSLPADSKFGPEPNRRILRDAMTGLIPEENRHRRSKSCFHWPLFKTKNLPLKEWLLSESSSDEFLQSDLWNGPQIREDLSHGKLGLKFLERAWPVFHVNAWRRYFKSGQAPSSASSHHYERKSECFA